MGKKIGIDCKIYYCEAGIAGTPVWTELTLVTNPSIEFAADEADASDRGSIFKKYLTGQIDAPLTIEMHRNVGHAGYQAFRDAFFNRTNIGVAMASGDIETIGTEYFQADWKVSSFPWSEPLNETGTISATLKIAGDSAEEPEIVDVSV